MERWACLCETVQIYAQGNVTVAPEGREGRGGEEHGDECDVGVVHGLKGEAGVVAIEVAVLHEIFDRIDDLEQSVSRRLTVYAIKIG